MEEKLLNQPTIKKKLELDIDVSPNYLSVNPFQKWIHLAKTVDAWRIFPRAFVSVYILLLYKVVTWFMTIPEPNLEQSALVSVVVGAMAAVLVYTLVHQDKAKSLKARINFGSVQSDR